MSFQNCHIAAIDEKIARCVRINRWRKSLAIFAGDQIRRDRRIKSPGVSPALHGSLVKCIFEISYILHDRLTLMDDLCISMSGDDCKIK